MDDKKALLGSGAGYLISTILIKGIVFLTMPLFTKLLSVEDFGIYNAYMSYEAVISIIMTMGTPVVIRSAWIEYTERFGVFEKSMNMLLFLVFGGILAAVMSAEFVSQGYVSKLLGLDTALLVCLLFHSSGYGLVITITEKYRMEFKALKVLVLSLAITVSSIAASLLLIHFKEEKYIGRIIGAALPYLVFWGCYFLGYIFQREKADKKLYKYILMLGIPAIPYILCENIMLQSDRVMIERFIGAYDAGIYSAISTMVSILMVTGNAIESVWAPWSYKIINSGQTRKLKAASTYYYLVYACISIGFGMIAPEMIRIFTSKEDYWGFSWLIYPMILMQFIYFTNKVPANLLLYYKKTKYSAYGIAFSAVLNVGLNYLAFKFFGFEAAAFTSLFCMAVHTALQLIWCHNFKMNIYEANKMLFICLCTTVIILTEFSFLRNVFARYCVGGLALCLILALFIRKFRLVDIISKQRKNGGS